MPEAAFDLSVKLLEPVPLSSKVEYATTVRNKIEIRGNLLQPQIPLVAVPVAPIKLEQSDSIMGD